MTKKILTVLSIIILLVANLTGCSSKEESIEGIWIAQQASQNTDVESNSVITNYNYWHVKKEKIELKYFTLQIHNGQKTKVFAGKEEKVNYELNDKDKAVIDNVPYKWNINQDKLRIWNDGIEILFERMNE